MRSSRSSFFLEIVNGMNLRTDISAVVPSESQSEIETTNAGVESQEDHGKVDLLFTLILCKVSSLTLTL